MRIKRMIEKKRNNTYQCPCGERCRLSTSSTDSEGVDEDHDLGATVQSRTEQEVVLAEPGGAVSKVI